MKIVVDLPEWYLKEIQEIKLPHYVDELIMEGQPLSEILDTISDRTAGVPYHFWDDEAYVSVHDIREIIERLKGGE